MTVKVVTDSTADLPEPTARELGITVVPVYVRFGETVYRDGVDISQNEFYQRLQESPVYPTTSQPAPADFADVYRTLSKEADALVSIHVTSKLSGAGNSALQGKEMLDTRCHIEVVDSCSVSMGLGLVAIAAARVADSLRERIASFLDMKKIHLSRLGPALGVYGGPGTLIIALIEKTSR